MGRLIDLSILLLFAAGITWFASWREKKVKTKIK